MITAEKGFPRGGKKPKVGFNEKNKFDFLGNSDKIGRKKRYKPKILKKDDPERGAEQFSDASSEADENIKAVSTDKISIETIQEGMTIMGRAMNIGDTKVVVSLPGRLSGTVMASHISVPYTKLLQSYVNDEVEDIKKLNALFHRGEYISVKVLSVKNTETNKKFIALSMMPQDINFGITHGSLNEGCTIRGAVESVEDHGYVIDLGITNCRAFLPSKYAQDGINLEIGQVIWCVVKKCQKSSTNVIVTVTNKIDVLKSIRIAGNRIQNYTINDLRPGMALDFHVNKPLKDGAEGVILTNLLGYIHVSQIATKLQIGYTARAYLLYVMPVSKLPFFTTREIFKTTVIDMSDEASLKIGTNVENAKVTKVTPKVIIFRFGEAVGIMPKKLSKASETPEENYMGLYKAGSAHNIRIINYHPSDYAYICSDNQATLEKKYFTFDDFQIGNLVEATVMKIMDKGVVVNIDSLSGWIPDVHISDVGIYKPTKNDPKYISLASKKFKIGQKISVRVLRVDPSKNLLHLTAKPSLLFPDLEILCEYEKAKIGHQYKGTIVHYLNFGVIVTFFGDVRAIVNVNEMSSEPIKDIKTAFNLGQVVTCTVLSVNVEEGKMICSFKPPLLNLNAENGETKEDDFEAEIKTKKSKKSKRKDKGDETVEDKNEVKLNKSKKQKGTVILDEIDIVENKKNKKHKIDNNIADESTEVKKRKKEKNNRTEDISNGFPSIDNFWELDASSISKNVTNENLEASSSDTDTEIVEKQKKKKKRLTTAEKVEKARQEEEKLKAIERQLTESNNQPQSSDQFDRLLLADPNNSELWIAYMAFHLQSTEIERARTIAKKALKTISFREEQDKLNVWLALLNLENRFGTKESLQVTIQEAIQMNDAYQIHSKLLDMYVETAKLNELSSLVDTMIARYKTNPTAYILAGQACYKLNMVDKARTVMQKAIDRLDSKQHVPVIIKFAHMENNNGDSERAETLFEQIVSCLPQRTDVWCVYVDLMEKSGKIENSRLILERAVSQKLSPKKMKIIYKKWLDIEEKYGNKEDIERVRRMAKEYVEKEKHNMK